MWVKLKGVNDWVNLDHAYRIEIRPSDSMARIYIINKEIIVTNQRVVYLGKEYILSNNSGGGLLSQAPWTLLAIGRAAKSSDAEEEESGQV